jgi:hypothetical protein
VEEALPGTAWEHRKDGRSFMPGFPWVFATIAQLYRSRQTAPQFAAVIHVCIYHSCLHLSAPICGSIALAKLGEDLPRVDFQVLTQLLVIAERR